MLDHQGASVLLRLAGSTKAQLHHRRAYLAKPLWQRLTFLFITLVCLLVLIGDFASLKVQADSANPTPVTTVDAASYQSLLAPNSIAAAFGTQLATGTAVATDADPNTPGIQLPTTLNGTTVEVNGVRAGLFFVSANQINYLIPPSTAPGLATVVVRSGDGVVSQGTLTVVNNAPKIFTASQTGAGAPAALVTPDGISYSLTGNPDGSTRPVPAGQVLVLFGTGFRNAAPGSVGVLIGGISSAVAYAGPQPDFVGLDQINVTIPESLAGRGVVDVVVTVGATASNTVNLEIAGASGSTPPTVSGFDVTEALAGQTITIQGSNFSPTPSQNTVRIGAMEAQVTQASATQLSVLLPYGVSTGKVKVQTAQGQGESAANLSIRTSISGTIQSTLGAALQGVTVRLSGTSKLATTNAQGLFLLSDVPPGAAVLEVDGSTVGATPPYPAIVLKMIVQANRDNQIAQPISLQQSSGSSGNVGGSGGSSAQYTLTRAERQKRPAVTITTDGVTLDIPGTATFPNGSTSGTVTVTVLQRDRFPVPLPPRVYSSTFVQITPFETIFSPPASLTLPNSDNIPANSLVDVYAYDTSITPSGFTKRGTGQVSSDGRSIFVSGVVDKASIWSAVPSQIQWTVVKGKVVNANDQPVRHAQAIVRGRNAFTDGNGAFSISDVLAKANETLTVEATHLAPGGIVLKASASGTAVVGGVTDVGTIKLPAAPQLLLALNPQAVALTMGASASLQLAATLPAPAGGYLVNLSSSDANVVRTDVSSVTIPEGKLTAEVSITGVGGGKATITATLADNSAKATASALVTRPAPALSSLSPASGPPFTQITINGSGFSPLPRQNLVSFEQNGQIIIAPPDSLKAIGTTAPTGLLATVPPLLPGNVQVFVVTLDANGVPSAPSNKLPFTVLGPPTIASITPNPAAVGSEVTITGTNFSPIKEENTVLFSIPRLSVPGTNKPIFARGLITSATTTELKVRVPGYAGSGPVIVVRNPKYGLHIDAGITLLDTLGGVPSALFLNFQVRPAPNFMALDAILTNGYPFSHTNSLAATSSRLVAANPGSGEVLIYDISGTNAAAPQLLASLSFTNQPPIEVAAAGNLALASLGPAYGIPTEDRSIQVNDPAADIIDLNTKTKAGTLVIPGPVTFDSRAALSGTTALVATGGTLYIFNVANPSMPVQLGSLSLGTADSTYFSALATNGTLALLAFNGKLAVIDISSPSAPVLKSTIADFRAVNTGTIPFDSDYLEITALTLSGSIAFAAVESRIVSLDLTNPAAPRLLGSGGFSFEAQSLAINGTILVVGSGTEGVALLDISDPAQPFTLSFYDTPGGDPGVVGVASVGNYIYTNEAFAYFNPDPQAPGGLISTIQFAGTPSTPRPIGGLAQSDWVTAGEILTLRGFNLGYKPSDLSVTIGGQTAPVLYANSTSIIETTNQTELTVQVPANLQPSPTPYQVDVNVASDGNLTEMITIVQEAALKRTRSFHTGISGAEAIVRIGSTPYIAVAHDFGGLSLINTETSEIASRLTAGQLRNAAFIQQIGYAQIGSVDYLVVFGFHPTAHTPGIVMINLSNPAKPYVVSDVAIALPASTLPRQAQRASAGNYRLQQNPGSGPDFGFFISRMVTAGTRAYAHTDRLLIFDLSNPAAPVLKGTFAPQTATNEPERTSGVALTGTATLALTTFEGSIYYLNATDPANIQVLGKYVAPPPQPSMPPALFHGPVLFVNATTVVAASISDGGLYFVDFATPANPSLVSKLQAPAFDFALDSQNNLLLMANESGNPFVSPDPANGDFVVVDIKNLSTPRLVTSLITPGSGRSVVMMGPNLYALADGADSPVGLHLISVDPAKFPPPPQIDAVELRTRQR